MKVFASADDALAAIPLTLKGRSFGAVALVLCLQLTCDLAEPWAIRVLAAAAIPAVAATGASVPPAAP